MNEEDLQETIDENVRWLRSWNEKLEREIVEKEAQIARNNRLIKELLIQTSLDEDEDELV